MAKVHGEVLPYNIRETLMGCGSTVDPWRPYTPHSTYGGAQERDDTLSQPFKVIPVMY